MLVTYLRKLLTFCGVRDSDITFVSVNNALTSDGPDAADRQAAGAQIASLAEGC